MGFGYDVVTVNIKPESNMRITLELWLAMAEFPHTEQRGERIAVCTHGLQLAIASLLYDLTDYVVWAVCGPYIELAKRR